MSISQNFLDSDDDLPCSYKAYYSNTHAYRCVCFFDDYLGIKSDRIAAVFYTSGGHSVDDGVGKGGGDQNNQVCGNSLSGSSSGVIVL